MNKYIFSSMLSLIIMATSCNSSRFNSTEKEFNEFLKQVDQQFIPLNNAINKAWYEAAISGKKEDYQKVADLNIKSARMFSNKQEFLHVRKMKESGLVHDSILSRQLDLLYLLYLSSQGDTAKQEEAIRMQSEIENKFTAYRAVVNSKVLSDNQVDSILRNSTNSAELEKVWKASKQIGVAVASDLITLIKKRNEIAKELGYANFYTMRMELGEQDPKQIEALFDELDALTKDAFGEVKNDIDAFFSKKYALSKEKLMPWHYQDRFFQEAPAIYNVNLDQFYQKTDILKIAANYYSGIGLPVEDIIARSDLYEKPGKNQHAFCCDIDRSGDVHILVNIRNDAYWMNTVLHELGHSVYSKFNDNTLPYLLRDAAHPFTTEAIALLFGRFYTNPSWIKDNLNKSEQEISQVAADCNHTIRLEQLVFSRWSQVMFRFEKALYENPEQDLNKLWWDLVEKYQLLKRPKETNGAEWAAKIHITTSPVYYHNYLIGELLASQLYNYISGNILKVDKSSYPSFTGNPEVGKYLTGNVFKPGTRYNWSTMIERATGEKLTAKYYAQQFVK